MVVDLSKVKTSEELSSAIGGNMTVPKAEQATPLESWKEQEYIALHNQIIAHGRNACDSVHGAGLEADEHGKAVRSGRLCELRGVR